MRILDHYIRNQVLASIFIVTLIVTGIESFMEFVQQLNDIGTGSYDIWHALWFVPLQLPTDVYQLFPMVGFLGSLIGLGRLASNSELIVMQASGVSTHRIAWAVLKAAIVTIVLVTIVGEVVAPILQYDANTMKTKAIGHPLDLSDFDDGIWLQQHHAFIHIAAVNADNSLANIMIFQFNQRNQLQKILSAPVGEFRQGQWWLQQGQQVDFLPSHLAIKHYAQIAVDFIFNPLYLQNLEEKANEQSLLGLVKNIFYREKTGLIANRYEFAFWQRLIQPVTTIVMICLGIPFIFGSLRTASMGSRLLVGVVVGFCFYMLNQFFGPISMVAQFPPILAALSPTLLFLMIYFILFRRVY